jgi:purine-cytosine permease-like protein
LTPWTAINLIDFYVVRRTHYSIREIFNPHGMYGRWNWRGPVAQALGGADISMLDGLPVSALLYWYLYRNHALSK